MSCNKQKQKETRKKVIEMEDNLVGGLEHEFYDFPYIGNVIIPTSIINGIILPS
jgi:hypothetical protein